MGQMDWLRSAARRRSTRRQASHADGDLLSLVSARGRCGRRVRRQESHDSARRLRRSVGVEFSRQNVPMLQHGHDWLNVRSSC